MPAGRSRTSAARPNTNAANAIASTHSTAPMIRPAATHVSHVVVRRRSTIGVSLPQSNSTSNVRIVSVSRSASWVASHRCSAAASSGSSASSRSIDSAADAQDHARDLGHHVGRARDVGVERDLAHDDPRAERPQPEPRALGRDGLHGQAPGLEHVDVARRVVLMEQDRACGHRDALEVGGQARGQPVGAGGGGVLPTRLVEARGGKQRVLASLQPSVQVGLEDHETLRLVHASAGELGTHRIGGAGEDDLRSGGLRQTHHLHERDDRRGVHARHAPQIDHQEPGWGCLRSGARSAPAGGSSTRRTRTRSPAGSGRAPRARAARHVRSPADRRSSDRSRRRRPLSPARSGRSSRRTARPRAPGRSPPPPGTPTR